MLKHWKTILGFIAAFIIGASTTFVATAATPLDDLYHRVADLEAWANAVYQSDPTLPTPPTVGPSTAPSDPTTTTPTTTTPAPTTTPTTTTTPPPPPSGRPFFDTANWLWNPIPANPALESHSAAWVNYFAASGVNQGASLYAYGDALVPASLVTPMTPRYDVTLTNNWGPDPFGTYTIPIPKGTKIPPGSDGHLSVQDPATGKVFSLWQARYNSGTDKWSASWGGYTDLHGDGRDVNHNSATATELSRYAGVVGVDEFRTAVANNTGLNHALFFSTDIACGEGGKGCPSGLPGFVYPAQHSDGTNIAGVATPMPEGYRVQLDPTINVDAIAGITPGEKVIAKTLQKYGAYAGDRGGSRMGFSFQLDPTATSSPGSVYANAGFKWDYYDMNSIPWSKLRVLRAWDGS